MFRASASQIVRRAAAQRASSSQGVAVVGNHLLFHSSAPRQEGDKKPVVAEPKKSSLWEPIYSIPLGLAFAVPAINYEWYIVNEETQLAACFMAFVMIIYKNFGGSIHEFLEQDGKRILAEHNKKEDEIIDLLEDQLADMKKQSGIVQDAEDIIALRRATYEKLNAAGQIKPKYEFKAQVEKLLTLIAHEEAGMREKAKHTLMEEATKTVTAQFASSKALQKSSLDNAIAQLEGKKTKGDPVQVAFVDFFKTKAKSSANADEKAEVREMRQSLVAKMNAVAMNEGFFFKYDEGLGKFKMVAAAIKSKH